MWVDIECVHIIIKSNIWRIVKVLISRLLIVLQNLIRWLEYTTIQRLQNI